MLKRKKIMESISSNLHGFLKRIGNIGLLRYGQPVVCQMDRQMPNRRTKFLSQLDRLEAHLVKDSDFDDKLKTTLPQVRLPFVQEEIPIILDLSNIAKPFAKKMGMRGGDSLSEKSRPA